MDSHLLPCGARSLFALLTLLCGAVIADEPEVWLEADLAFFESRIRPVLVEHCYRCHSNAAAEKNQLKGGLRVDSRAGLLQGGETGPAIVPGHPDDSLLLQALRYETFEMPPAGRLPERVVADFAAWIERGAADPRSASTPLPSKRLDLAQGRQHWAYRPLPLPPRASSPLAGASTPIDAFLATRWRTAGVTPVPLADPTTLARRLCFDLTGLPPTPGQLEALAADPSPEGYARFVDELLASPQFGVRWGRHWLDVVRFAESVTLRGLVQHQAWRYRDFVIDTFNRDRAFNEFLRAQVAGDLLPADSIAERQRLHIATTFLTLTDANLEEQDKEQLRMDVVDEQLSVIGEALLGQTLGCARCHDHKFDPIPTTDYYALAGILRNTRTLAHANVSRWLERPLPLPPEEQRAVAEHAAELRRAREELAVLTKPAANPGARMVARESLPGIVVDDDAATLVGEWKESTSVRPYVDGGYRHDLNTARGEKSATFRAQLPADGEYEVRLSYTAAPNRSSAVSVTIECADGDVAQQINQQVPPPIDGLFLSLGTFRFTADQPALVAVSNAGANGHVIIDALQFLPVSAATTRPAEAVTGSPPAESDDRERQTRARRIAQLERRIKDLERTGPTQPLYQGVEEEATIAEPRVNIRGNVHNLGRQVPRGFLQVVPATASPEFPGDQSGRVQLGDWLADPANPLPARVYANRVWHWLFGAGIVATPDNFGTTGQPPSHPELLDYLAGRLVAQGWSTKALIREIVLSDAYRRQSIGDASNLAVDPENRLLWRMNPKRLEAECLLDAILLVSGELDDAVGGPTVPPDLAADYSFQHTSRRRAVYWPQLRNSRPELLQVFDGANPSLVTGRRNVSSVAPQALYLMNSPWIMDHARRTAARLLADAGLSESLRIQTAFRRILGRSPAEAEERAVTQFLSAPAGGDRSADEMKLDRWTHFVQSLFCSLDFRYLH